MSDGSAVAGQYNVVFVAKPEQGSLIQKTYSVDVVQESDTTQYVFVFPDRLSDYSAKTRIFQSKTDKVYECKPFTYSGYCIQWSKSATHFEPGVGSNWKDAWIEL